MDKENKPLTGDLPDNDLGMQLNSREYRSRSFHIPAHSKEKKEEQNPVQRQNFASQSSKKDDSNEKAPSEFFSKILAFFQFITISGLVFSTLFLILNWSAYSQILASYINPEEGKKEEVALHQAIIEPKQAQNLIKIERQRKEVKKSFPALTLKVAPPDNRIIIPKIGKNVPLVDLSHHGFNSLEQLAGKEFEGAIQEGLKKGVIHYPGTAQPGQYGNFFVTGHSSYYPWDTGNYKDVFVLLNKLEVGDIYYVYYNQKKYTYKVSKKFEVQPTDISVLEQPYDKKMSTLMTCTPVGTDLRRLIIQSEQIMAS